MDAIQQLNHHLSNSGFSSADLIIIGISVLLFFAATPICRLLNGDHDLLARISTMRVLNFLVVLAIILKHTLLKSATWVPAITQCLIVIYFAVLATQVTNYFIRQRFGKQSTQKDKTVISDTYSSRALSLLFTILITLLAIVTCLRVVGLDSWLEAGGALGIMGLILAMTQASWAPDIISGLIILNSRLCEEGDVIRFNMDGKLVVASVFKTKFFHTECLDLSNNHRIMIRNTKLRDYGIENLSRFASARGLREVLFFNIDYQHDQEEVTAMFNRAFAEIDKAESMREEQFEPEIRVHETGDYAVMWAVYYYTKEVRQVLAIRQLFRSYILAEATRSNISLATPQLQNIELSNPIQ